jgi:regulator of sigma E protease
MNPILLTLLLWGAVNIAHLLGHLAAARLFRFAPNRISLGVGFTIWQRQLGATTFRVAMLPVAFVVRLREPYDNKTPQSYESDDPRSFRNKSLLARFAAVIMAPAFVFVLVFIAAYYQAGLPLPTERPDRVALDVVPGFPADLAGIRSGDVVLRINDGPATSFKTVIQRIARSADQPVRFVIKRGDSTLRFSVQPKPVAPQGRLVIGVRLRYALTVGEPPGLMGRIPVALG